MFTKGNQYFIALVTEPQLIVANGEASIRWVYREPIRISGVTEIADVLKMIRESLPPKVSEVQNCLREKFNENSRYYTADIFENLDNGIVRRWGKIIEVLAYGRITEVKPELEQVFL